jgi:hypothetical protein
LRPRFDEFLDQLDGHQNQPCDAAQDAFQHACASPRAGDGSETAMQAVIFGILVLLMLGAVIVRPKIGALLIWPVLIVYPHGLQAAAHMPQNLNFGDVFVIFVAIMVFLRVSGRQRRMGPTLKIAIAMWIICSWSAFFGLLQPDFPQGDMPIAIRSILKQGGLVALCFCFLETLDTPEDCWRMARWFAFSIAAAGLVVIVGMRSVAVSRIFDPGVAIALGDSGGELNRDRGFGSLMSANSAAQVLSYGICVSIILYEYSRGWRRWAFFAVPGTLAVGIFFTGSRTGFITLALIPAVLLLMHGLRKWAAGYALGAFLVPLAVPRLFRIMMERVSTMFVKGGDTLQLSHEASTRPVIWAGYLHSLTPTSLALGQGNALAVYRALVQTGAIGLPHNGYLNLLCYWGIPGVIWWLVFMYVFIRFIRRLRRYGREGLLWSRAMTLYLITMSWAACTLDAYQPGTLLFQMSLGLLALTERMERTLAERYEAQAELDYGDAVAECAPAW